MRHSTRIAARLRLLRRKISRERLSPEAVAGGWALGMFVGCAVPFGFQLVVSIPLAIRFGLSRVGATLGTFVTNPVTILFIYPAQTFAVNRLVFGGTITFSRLRGMEWTFQSVAALGWEVMASFLAGGLILAALLTPPTYFIVRRMAIACRERERTRASQ